MSDLTIVMPFYLNKGMLALQYAGWAAWPEEIKDRVQIILVDDGSPEGHAVDVDRPEGLPALSIYRVTEDRPWHQHAARNLGAHVAGQGWLLLTDMDHVLTEEAARALLKRIRLGKLDPEAIYTLARIEADTGKPTMQNGKPKPHPNSFVVTRKTFWRIGGYDEEYRGYGTDGKFKERAFSRATKGHLDKVALTRYWRELVPDASTTVFGRKEDEWRCNTAEITRRKLAEGRANDILTLDFPWEKVL